MSDKRFAFFGSGWLAIAAVLVMPARPVLAWHGKGHHRATHSAVRALPDDMPRFFRDGAATIAHCSLDPDVFTRPIAPDALHRSEAPEHYFDLERLGDMDIPGRRDQLLMWCGKKDIHPSKVGLLPYAIVEWTQRLSTVFAEHRKWPGNPHIRSKARVYAGILAHYAQDLCMPLHTTIHYDGRVRPDGSSPKTGIHLKVDALLGKLPAGAEARLDAEAVTPFEQILPAVVSELKASHALVDRVYELAEKVPAYDQPLKPNGPAADFTAERFKASALFTARLMLTAWRDSVKIKMPKWHHRPAATSSPVEGQ